MRVAIVGLPFSGKSTLFSAISGIPAGNLKPGEENLAAVKVPDVRLDYLEKLYVARKRTEATMEFVDLPAAGDASEAAAAGLSRHLPTLRQADALLLTLRAFENEAVPLTRGVLDPAGELRSLREEMLLADLLICDNRVEKLEKAILKPTKEREQQKAELDLLKRCRESLENEKPLSQVVSPGEEEKMLRSFGFLTQKRVVVVFNVDEARIAAPPPFVDELAAATFSACASIEAEIMQMDPADRGEFMAGYGINEAARDRIIRASFDALGMICFLTAGEEEVRAWPVPRGASAVEAAGKIHSDLARGFIRAETVAFDDLKAAGSMRDAKAANKVRMEPKHYVVLDGDIMNIKFAV